MRNARMPEKVVYLLILIAAIFVAGLPALGQGYTEAEREALFWASHQFAQEKSALPRRVVGLFTTTVGTDGGAPVNWGGKVEAALTNRIWVSVEAMYLADDGVDGFASVKLYPGDRRTVPVYLGFGTGLGKAFDYQLFAGVELVKRFYVEVKYVNTGGTFKEGTPYLAAGFTLSF